jgi:hypothetical protein
MVIFWKYRANALNLQKIQKGILYYTSKIFAFVHI